MIFRKSYKKPIFDLLGKCDLGITEEFLVLILTLN